MALAIGWDLTTGYLFPVDELNGDGGTVPLIAPRVTTALQAHLQAVGGARPLRDAIVRGRRIA